MFMNDAITEYLEWKSKTKTGRSQATPEAPVHSDSEAQGQQVGFPKVFRWPVTPQQTSPPTIVEVVGSFSDWQRVPLTYDKPTKTWLVTLNNIRGNHTHRYVFLVDGKPSYDKTCDGLATPESSQEERWQIETPKGPRVMLLFSQTK